MNTLWALAYVWISTEQESDPPKVTFHESKEKAVEAFLKEEKLESLDQDGVRVKKTKSGKMSITVHESSDDDADLMALATIVECK